MLMSKPLVIKADVLEHKGTKYFSNILLQSRDGQGPLHQRSIGL